MTKFKASSKASSEDICPSDTVKSFNLKRDACLLIVIIYCFFIRLKQ